MKKLLFLLLIIALSINVHADTTLFESKIRPVLAEKCYSCHSKTASKVKGGLLLDSGDGWVKGGESAMPLIDKKNPEKSHVIQSLLHLNDSPMPPKESDKLTSQQVNDFIVWIKSGANFPKTSGVENAKDIFGAAAKNHWAYQPIRKPSVPRNIEWGNNEIDKFVFAKMTQAGLKPSDPASKEELIRRAYYDLIGLPPTIEEIDAFVQDPSHTAYEKVIDKLLNSVHYGERWGRYWLDVARYSDTTGTVNGNREPRYTYSYTYRDYVIKSFNDDKPFNVFIKEQLAADLIPNSDKVNLAALGFLTLGKDSGNVNDVIDDRIDVVTKGFMGTTVVCARCHDHKFDPVSTKDYYSLHGLFSSTYTPPDSEKPLIVDIKDTADYRNYVSNKNVIMLQITNFVDTKFNEAFASFRTNTSKWLYGAYALQNVANSNRSDFIRTNTLNSRMMQKWGDSLRLTIPQRARGQEIRNNTQRVTHPVFLPFAKMFNVSEDAKFGSNYLAMVKSNESDINPFLLQKIKSRSVRNMMDLATVYHSCVEDIYRMHKAGTDLSKINGAKEFYDSVFLNNGPLSMNRTDFQRYYADNGMTMRYDNDLRRENGKLITLELTHKATPARAMAILDRPTPVESQVFIKGDPNKRGDRVPRRFLEFFGTGEKYKSGSGRLELANDIISTNNPLTSRVIINRIWQNHFTEGFIKTPDDFGVQTPEPIHSALLDYLAFKLMEDGWKLKSIHKYIMMSAVYQQTAKANPNQFAIDPNNNYLSKMNMRKLEFEALRDTILFIGGSLDLTTGGQSVDISVENKDGFSKRKSIYSLIDRNRLPEFFSTFDFATPEMTTGKRFNTTVPKQALFLMNSQIVIEQVELMVKSSTFKSISTDIDKITYLYKKCLQRTPDQLDLTISTQFLKNSREVKNDKLDEWEQLAHVLLMSNEMVFIK